MDISTFPSLISLWENVHQNLGNMTSNMIRKFDKEYDKQFYNFTCLDPVIRGLSNTI